MNVYGVINIFILARGGSGWYIYPAGEPLAREPLNTESITEALNAAAACYGGAVIIQDF